MAMFLWKPFTKAYVKNPFSDVPKSPACYKAILWTHGKGIAKGYSDGTFRAGNNATKGEVVEFLRRF